MVKKKKTATKRRTVTTSPAPRKRRAKAGYDKIAPAMATVGLVIVNKDNIKALGNFVGQYGLTGSVERFVSQSNHMREIEKKFVNTNQLVKDAVAVAGGYVAGEVVRKYAPTVVKKPVAKLAKKIPKVI